MNKNFGNALEVIGQLVFDNDITEESNPEVFNLIEAIQDCYVRIEWPESQQFMEEDWFLDEAIHDNSENVIGCTYLIPLKHIL